MILSNTVALTNVSMVPGEKDNLVFVLGENKLQLKGEKYFIWFWLKIKNSVMNYFILLPKALGWSFYKAIVKPIEVEIVHLAFMEFSFLLVCLVLR